MFRAAGRSYRWGASTTCARLKVCDVVIAYGEGCVAAGVDGDSEGDGQWASAYEDGSDLPCDVCAKVCAAEAQKVAAHVVAYEEATMGKECRLCVREYSVQRARAEEADGCEGDAGLLPGSPKHAGDEEFGRKEDSPCAGDSCDTRC